MPLFRIASPHESGDFLPPLLFWPLASGLLFSSALPLLAASTSAPEAGKFFSRHCLECHDKDTTKGGVNLESLKWEPASPASFELWTKVYDQVSKGEMPPKKVTERPAAGDAQALMKGIATALNGFEQQRYTAEGRTKLRRLNRQEYERTVHDLLGIDIPLASLLPADTAQFGFDTVADGLRLSQLQMETYLEAAEAAVDAAIQLGPEPTPMKKRWYIKDEESVRKNLDSTMVLMGSNLGNANSHDWRNLPIMLAAGGFKHGQHVACDAKNNTPLSNLFVQMLQHMNFEVDAFGTSTGSGVPGFA